MSSQEDIILDGLPDPSGFNKDVLFDPKPKPKIIRVLTVMAYVLSVSMAAIMLSIYYIFMWDGRPHIGALRHPSSEGFSIPRFTESVENVTEHHYKPSLLHPGGRNSSARLDKFEAENTAEEIVEASTSPSLTTETVGNYSTDSASHNYDNTEMQQQFTDGDAEVMKILPTVATRAEDSSSDNITGPRDFETLDDFSGASPFMKKLIDYNRYYEDY